MAVKFNHVNAKNIQNCFKWRWSGVTNSKYFEMRLVIRMRGCILLWVQPMSSFHLASFCVVSFLFKNALLLAYTCPNRTWQLEGSERYCCALSSGNSVSFTRPKMEWNESGPRPPSTGSPPPRPKVVLFSMTKYVSFLKKHHSFAY